MVARKFDDFCAGNSVNSALESCNVMCDRPVRMAEL